MQDSAVQRICKKLNVTVTQMMASGTLADPNTVIFEAVGKATDLHKVWKLGLNILKYASGIATRTQKLVAKINEINPRTTLVTTMSAPGSKPRWLNCVRTLNVRPGLNSFKISGVKDLAKPGVRLILPDRQATALGQTAFKIFTKLGIAAAVEQNVSAYMETPDKVLVALQMSQGDAGIVEYSNAKKDSQLGFIEIDPAVNIVDELPCASLNCSTQKEATR